MSDSTVSLPGNAPQRTVLVALTWLIAAVSLLANTPVSATPPALHHRVSVTLAPALDRQPLTGRMFFLFSRNLHDEPRLVPVNVTGKTPSGALPVWLYGQDVAGLRRGAKVLLDSSARGFPFATLADLPRGDYLVQAVLHVYTRFDRADGYRIWAHWDRGEGQYFANAPGNLVSEPVRVHYDPKKSLTTQLTLTRELPSLPEAQDKELVKHLRIRSELLSKFWGHDMFLKATVILPKGYDQHRDVQYPAAYWQGHLGEMPFWISDDLAPVTDSDDPPGKDDGAFKAAWLSDSFPRMILISTEHPTPFYDDSYWINSEHDGPWADAFLTELIPYLESHFRIIPKTYARVMAGVSTGGYITASLQIHYPDVFGGAWSMSPDPVDFRDFFSMNLYDDSNAYQIQGYEPNVPERTYFRTVKGQPIVSMRQSGQLMMALGSRGRSSFFTDQYAAMFGPVDQDGYPRMPFDPKTGQIDEEVISYWRLHGYDLREYTESHWPEIGPKLVGKLHFTCGDMDNYSANLALYRMQDFLDNTKSPAYEGSFKWGRPLIGHQIVGFDPFPQALLLEMAQHVVDHAPTGEDAARWHYQ